MNFVCNPWILVMLIFLLTRFIIYHFLICSHKKIKKFVYSNLSDAEGDSEIKKEEDKSKRQAELVEKRDKELIWISILVGILEFLIFTYLAYLVLKGASNDFERGKYISIFLGGWLGIKLLSNHRPWSDFIAGKAYYHVSLVATLINIGAAILSGYIFYN